MQHLHTSLLFICLLALQDTASAFFRAKPLPPNKHWLKFKHAGGEVAVKLNLERLRVLAERMPNTLKRCLTLSIYCPKRATRCWC